MQIAVDISLYPLNADYVPPIKDFIERIGRHPGLTLEYNSMSTQLRGEFEAVFAALRVEVRESFAQPDRTVFVIKMLGGAPPPR
ncbi:MAG TPA: YkoF family thiamine/hydroxymethylpyrimidine-binding protein [Steroidobacteraceae bacterium]|nr:YkoF family thiamine/hydroxymethylpyrimidine-binding protein [Steroidobacteraceae bacterium]